MKICIVGLGYVGLPAACVLAQSGHEVLGVEIRADVVESLNQGQIHIDEPGLHDLLQEALQQGRFQAQTKPEVADAFILCVPTPFQTGYQPDLSYVEAAARSVLPVLKEGRYDSGITEEDALEYARKAASYVRPFSSVPP